MKPSAVYREAARRIAEGERTLSCTTIISVSIQNKDAPPGLVPKYIKLLAPHKNSRGLWLDKEIPQALRQQWRVLALCFMAAIADAGDA